jgi:hypothetical protein
MGEACITHREMANGGFLVRNLHKSGDITELYFTRPVFGGVGWIQFAQESIH